MTTYTIYVCTACGAERAKPIPQVPSRCPRCRTTKFPPKRIAVVPKVLADEMDAALLDALTNMQDRTRTIPHSVPAAMTRYREAVK